MEQSLAGLIRIPSSAGAASPLLADNWDPVRRDYASLSEGMDVVDSLVVFAVGTVRGSGASVLNEGMPAPPSKITDSLEAELDSNVRRALQRLTSAGLVRLKRVSVEQDPGNQAAGLRIDFVNLRTQKARDVFVPLPTPGLG